MTSTGGVGFDEENVTINPGIGFVIYIRSAGEFGVPKGRGNFCR